jgi:hypothetical protein
MKKIISIGVFLLALVLGTLATHAQITISGNPTCRDAGFNNDGFKIDNPQLGTNSYTIPGQGGISTTINTLQSVSFLATSPFVEAMLIKGGNKANIYYYNPAVTAGNDLQTPFGDNGVQTGLSHILVCFTLRPTAAHVSISGQVLTSSGAPISRVSITTTTDSGEIIYTNTDSLGQFTLSNLQVGKSYVIVAKAKGYTFNPTFVNLLDEVSGLTILAN